MTDPPTHPGSSLFASAMTATALVGLLVGHGPGVRPLEAGIAGTLVALLLFAVTETIHRGRYRGEIR